MQTHPLLAPVFPAGREPLPPGMTEEDRANVMQVKKYQDYMSAGMESCLGKTTVAGVFGTPCFSLSYLTYRFFFRTFVRFRCRWILFVDVFVVCVRGPVITTELEHHTKVDGDIQGDGPRYVEERKGLWEGRSFVRGDRVRHRIGSHIFYQVFWSCPLTSLIHHTVSSAK